MKEGIKENIKKKKKLKKKGKKGGQINEGRTMRGQKSEGTKE